MSSAILELIDVTKTFGSKVANDRISIRIAPGTVHALVGENGAGKSTLVNMINGLLRPDSGQILFDDKEVKIDSPQDAAALGIGMVHQHFKLVPSYTVAANIFLGREMTTRLGILDTRGMNSAVSLMAGKFGLNVDPEARVSKLSVGLRQRVEVLKALSYDTRLLILDEPTAVLTPGEAEELFSVMRSLAAAGCAVLFISHKLGEVLSVADEITVIRDGRAVQTMPNVDLSEADIARLMVGREVLLRVEHTPARPAEPVLELDDISLADQYGASILDGVGLTVRRGEIVGIAGVEGNGQSELADVIAGMISPTRGRVRIDGRDVTGSSVSARRARGLAYIPEDRDLVGAGPGLDVTENVLPGHLTKPRVRAGWISISASRAFARSIISRFDVRGARVDTPVGSLSGGNAQKVIIGRELMTDPQMLLVSQPTRGVDVGAMEFVHNAIVRQRDSGAGVLVISADLNEVMSLSDRLLVMYRGKIAAEFDQTTMTEEAVGLAMSGIFDSSPAAIAPARSAVGTPGVTAQRSEDASKPEAVTSSTSPREVPPPNEAERRLSRLGGALSRFTRGLLPPVAAILLALLIGAILIVAIGRDPLEAYAELFLSSFRTPQGFGALLAQFVPLSVLAAAVIIPFRAGLFNLGGEGQLFIGAFLSAWVAFSFTELPAVSATILAIAVAMLGGMLWGTIPGVLVAVWRVDIIVTTLMLSSIGVLLTAYLVTGPFQDPTAGQAATERVPAAVRLPVFSVPFGIGLDLVIAVSAVVILALVLNRSVWGLQVRQVGELNNFARYTGVNPKAINIQVMALSGAFAGLVGALIVLGPIGGRFVQTFSPGYAFIGITVALLARLNPWAALLAAAFYANMMAGASRMQIQAGVPYPLVNVLQGLIILSITATIVLDRRSRERLRSLFRRAEVLPPPASSQLHANATSANESGDVQGPPDAPESSPRPGPRRGKGES